MHFGQPRREGRVRRVRVSAMARIRLPALPSHTRGSRSVWFRDEAHSAPSSRPGSRRPRRRRPRAGRPRLRGRSAGGRRAGGGARTVRGLGATDPKRARRPALESARTRPDGAGRRSRPLWTRQPPIWPWNWIRPLIQDGDPSGFPGAVTIGGQAVRILREYHPDTGGLLRIYTALADREGDGGRPILHGPEWSYFETGAQSALSWWKEDVLHGPVKQWRPVGTLKFERRYVDGERDGLSRGLLEGGPPGRGGDLRRGAARWAAARVVRLRGAEGGGGVRPREASGGKLFTRSGDADAQRDVRGRRAPRPLDRLPRRHRCLEELRQLRDGAASRGLGRRRRRPARSSRRGSTPLASCTEGPGSGPRTGP